jgi:outer membrane immunogenic protein
MLLLRKRGSSSSAKWGGGKCVCCRFNGTGGARTEMGIEMKKFLLGGVTFAALAIAGPAIAADIPAPVYKAPVVAPLPIYDWTGFYIGLNGGYSWGRSATDYTVAGLPVFSTTQKLNGWVAGGQAGYNWQFNRNWVFGVEADIQATGQKGTATLAGVTVCPPAGVAVFPCTTTTGSFEQKLPWLGTARLRLGFLPSDHWMLYVTGGLAYGEVETTATVNTAVAFAGGPVIASASAVASANTTRAGWTVGGGAEWVISGPWTAKLEYLYVDLGTVSNTFTGLGAFTPLTTSSHVTDNIVRVGLNYRFGGPVVAKY